MVGQIYPTELQLNKANSSDTEAPFLDLNLSITNGIVSSKIYDKRDDFNFEIVNFPFLDGDVPRSPSYGVYTRGVQYVMKTAQYIPNFYIYTLYNYFIKRSVSWLNKCKIAVVELLTKFTQATFKIGY